MSMFDSVQLLGLQRFLDMTAARQNALTTNIANLDTPGYRTKDVDFRQVLQAAGTNMRAVSSSPRLHEVQGLLERPDGNNVSLERESMLLAQTQLQFQTGVQLLRSEFRRLLTAINEGK